MRWTKVLLAAALLLGAAPATATGAPRLEKHATRAAWLAERERLGTPLGLDEELVAAAKRAAEADTEDYAVLVRAGDLDGDGTDDVVDVRDHVVFDDATGSITESIRLEARRGRDGAALWTVTPSQQGYVYPIFTATGPKGRPGVIVVAYSGAFADGVVAGAGQEDTTVTSYDGAGKQLWTQAFQGAGLGSAQGFTEGFTDVTGLFDAVAGGGTDLLLRTQADSFTADPTYTAVAYAVGLRVSVIDGATGTQRDLGTPVLAAQGDAFPYAAGDLDGDKRDDVVVVSQTNDVPTATALRSNDGMTLWTYAGTAAAHWLVTPLTDVTGNGKDDVAVRAYSYDSDKETVTLLDGTNGKARWTKDGWSVLVLGDADRKHGDEVAVISVAQGDAFGITASAYNGSGTRIWTSKRTVKTSDLQGGAYAASWGFVGDTNSDGVSDVGYSVVVTPFGKNARRDEGTIDGRKGHARRDPVADLFGTSVALDGRGSDGYTRTVAHGVLTVTAWRGDRPAKLWTVAIPVKADSPFSSFGTYADRDRCGDLAVSVSDGTTYTSVMLSGKTARPLWALVRSGNGAAKVTHPAVKSVKHFGRGC